MRTKGQVIFVSRNHAMLVIHHSDGYAVVEMLGREGEIEVGAIVSGDWNALGGEPIFMNGEPFDAYYQGNWGSRDAALRIARNTGGG